MRAVFATDLSEANEAAIRSRTCLECLNRYGIDEIHLITVVSANVHAAMPGFDFDERRERALETQRRIFEDAGFDVETSVMRGTPHRRINGLAERIGADLIIVGSRGQSPLERRLIGSTARNVARTAVAPLLIERIRDRGGEPEVAREHLFREVLYATDFSGNADRAFEQFAHLRSATEEATLLHVLGPEQRRSDLGIEDPTTRLEELADQLVERDIEANTLVREGVPGDEILAAEEMVDPTLILMGSRGLSRLRRLLIGSVSEEVVARSNANVLLVPPSRMA